MKLISIASHVYESAKEGSFKSDYVFRIGNEEYTSPELEFTIEIERGDYASNHNERAAYRINRCLALAEYLESASYNGTEINKALDCLLKVGLHSIVVDGEKLRSDAE